MPSRLVFISLVALASSAAAQLAPRVATSLSAADSIAARDSACAAISVEASASATPDCTHSVQASQERARRGEAWKRVGGATIGVATIAGALVGIRWNDAAIPRSFEPAGLEQLDLMLASALDSRSDPPGLSPAQVFRSSIAGLEGWSWEGNQVQDIGGGPNFVTAQFATGLSGGLQDIFAFVFRRSRDAQEGIFRHAIFNGAAFAPRAVPVRYDSWGRAEGWRRDLWRQEVPSNSADMTATPEPATLTLTASGLIALVGCVRRKRRQSQSARGSV